MNLLSAFHVLIIAVDLVVGLFVFFTNPQRRANQSFFILSLLLMTWQSCMALGFLAPNLDTAAAFIRGCMLIGAMIPVCFDWMRAAIVHPADSWRRIMARSPFLLALSIIIGLLSLTHFFILGATYPVSATPSSRAIPDPVYNTAFPLYGVFFVFCLMTLLYRFIRDLRRSSGIQKTELQFIFLGSGTSVFIGIVTALVIPLFIDNSQSVQLTPLSVLCLYVVIAYGIATRRIMDVAYFMRRLTAYALLLVCLTALYAGTWAILNLTLSKLWIPLPALSYFVASLVVAFSMAPANGLMQRLAARLFVHFAPLDMNYLVRSANSLVRSINTVETLLHEFAELLIKTVGIDRVCILMVDADQYIQHYPKTEGTGALTVSKNHHFPQVLLQTGEPLVPMVLSRLKPSPQVMETCHLIEEWGFDAAIGLRSKEGLEGIVLLGPRLSGSIYGAPEQEALQLLCNHMAVALSNAKLYTQLQDSKIYNEILVDSLVSGVVAASHDGNVTVFNREAQRITRLSPSTVLNHDRGSLPTILAELLNTTLTRGQGLRDQELLLPTPSGDAVPIRVSSSVFYGHTGKLLGAFLVINDLTTVKQLEHQIRRTDRLASLGTLAAGMAHEIKNPLVSIKTFTQLLPERYDDSDFRETFSSLVGGEVKRIDSIVNQLLRFSRPSKPVLSPTALHEILQSGLKLIQQQLRAKNIHLATTFTSLPDRINADGDQLSQAFINFFLNAIESIQEGGSLTVTTAHASVLRPDDARGQINDETIVVSIQDTGEGITPENLTHIFDPFFTTKSQGTGLGLSVAHGIIHDHGGTIDVKSEPGSGTTFTLAFPLFKEEVPS